MPNLPPPAEKFLRDLEKQLNEPGRITNILGSIEAKTGIKRLYIVGALVLIQSIYLVYGGSYAQLICNLIGFVYPAYISIKAIESRTKDDDTQWLIYWVVFAWFSIIEVFNQTLLHYLPFFYFGKCVFLLYLYLPMTQGAQVLYINVIRPIHLQYQKAEVDPRKGYDEHVKPN